MDRSGLAITTILASTVLQTDARSTLVSTWLDTFFVISISFQFITFFMSVVTAHYAFDPDYQTEREQHLMVSAKEIESPRGGGEIVKQGTLAFYAGQVLRVSDSILGDERDPITDVIGRRYVVPVFLVINILLPFFPYSGPDSVLEHPEAGVNSILFKMSLSILLGWFLLVIARVILLSNGFKALAPGNYEPPSEAYLEDPAESVYIDSGMRKSSDVADVHWPTGSSSTANILADNKA